LKFNSNFESGNLLCAAEVGTKEYDLYCKVDTNTKGHCSWFYFTVTARTTDVYKFNIVNMVKAKTTMAKEGYPYCCVHIEGERDEWYQLGRSSNKKYVGTVKKIFRESPKKFWTLTWEHQLIEGTKYSFAYSIPYTYSRL